MLAYTKNVPEYLTNKLLKFVLVIATMLILIFVKEQCSLYPILMSIVIGYITISLKNELEQIPMFIKNIIQTIATTSYSIYLYNYIFEIGTPIYRNTILIFCYILFVFGFGYFMYLLVEKPINNLSHKILK
jgi:peptidoglycan/LPS O-acetylase OafA/YrhL